jgi:hypothetical protein
MEVPHLFLPMLRVPSSAGAQFTNEGAYAACYQCLSNDAMDPCTCVDGVKNGTITFAPGENPPAPLLVCESRLGDLVREEDGFPGGKGDAPSSMA